MVRKAMAKFKTYREAHTEWAIFFLKFIEMILSLTCMIYHIEAIIYTNEPMPHNMLFCATFGGSFILSLAGMLVPISGQLSPPGVDMMFSLMAFFFLFCSACAAMYYIANDDHLTGDKMTDFEEADHPFFVHCRTHCIMSLITGTFHLMHAAIAADRLNGMRHGLDEAQAEINSLSSNTELIVDIDPETPLTLHLFMLDWWIYVWQTKYMVAVREYCICNCCLGAEQRSLEKAKKRKKRGNPHFKAYLNKQRLSSIQSTSYSHPEPQKKQQKSPQMKEQTSSGVIKTLQTLFQSEE